MKCAGIRVRNNGGQAARTSIRRAKLTCAGDCNHGHEVREGFAPGEHRGAQQILVHAEDVANTLRDVRDSA